MVIFMRSGYLVALIVAVAGATAHASFVADPVTIRRGQYLVTFGGCNDCHTPGYFLGKADENRYLGGSDVGLSVPGLGTFVGPNLTPDRETGLGNWSNEDITNALQKGITPEGRELAPVMPWHAFAHLTPQDANAIAIYLRTLPPVSNKVPGPFGPNEHSSVPVLKVVGPGGHE
jgi:mono/diheme cytochrome c family protein